MSPKKNKKASTSIDNINTNVAIPSIATSAEGIDTKIHDAISGISIWPEDLQNLSITQEQLDTAATKIEKNKTIIDFSYGRVIIDSDKAQMLLDILSNAESIKGYNVDKYRIEPIGKQLDISLISNQDYLCAKLRNLLIPEEKDDKT